MFKITEHLEQTALIERVKVVLEPKFPECAWLYAVPNQGGSGLKGLLRSKQMKLEGGKAGVSDLCLPSPRVLPAFLLHAHRFPTFMGLYIEMKKPPNVSPVRKSVTYNYPTYDQHRFIKFVRSQGYMAECCNGQDEAFELLSWYLNLERVENVGHNYSYVEEVIRKREV